MVYKFIIGTALLLIAPSSFSGVTGIYVDSRGYQIEIGKGEHDYSLSIEDRTQTFENVENVHLSHCLLFDSLDILLPKKFVLDETFECMGSQVTVVDFYEELILDGNHLKKVYKIVVERSGSVVIGEKKYKRPGGKKKFELYYSMSSGLIGFKLDQVYFFQH